MTVNMDVTEVFELVTDLEGAAKSVTGKARNILRRGGAEVREAWHKSAQEFPSPTKARDENYDISYDMRGSNATTVAVTIGSDDPLLEVIEYGSSNHAPQLHGLAALDRAIPGVTAALAWIDGVTDR